jgi:hypothetical protein
VAGAQGDLALAGWDGEGDQGPVLVLGEDGRRKTEDGDFVIGPVGDGLWRRMPWPVRDSVFDLEPPPDPGAVLVVGDESVASRLRENGAAVDVAERLTLDGLRSAAVVVLLAGHGALPAASIAVLAARRVLVADATAVTFGLQDGIEFLRAGSADEAVARADLARVHPGAVRSLRVMGARAAREYRASSLYPRLAADLA